MRLFARLKSIVLAAQNCYEGASAVPALSKKNEDAMASHLGWERRSNNSEEVHAEVVFAPAQRGLLKHQFTPSNVYPRICMFRNKFRSLFSDLLIRFSVNIIQFRALASRQGQHAKSSDPST